MALQKNHANGLGTERTTVSASMHEGVETWDSECGCGVPHWGEQDFGDAGDETDSIAAEG